MTSYRFGSFLLDPAARELTSDGVSVVLPARAFACLLHLIEHRERAVGRDELAQAVFGRSNVSDAQIGQIVLRARRAVGDDGQGQHAIRTVPRFGFRWIAPTQAVDGSSVREAAVDSAPPDVAPAPAVPAPAMPERRQPRHWPARALPWLGAALLLAVVAAVAWRWSRAPLSDAQAKSPPVTLVLPTEVRGTSDAAWVRLGLMDFISDRMRRGGVAVPPSENTLVMLGNAPGQPAVDEHRRIVRSVAARRGAGWTVTLSARAGDRTITRADATGPDLLAAAARASDRLLTALGQRPAEAAGDLGLQERLQRARAAMLANEVDNARRILLAAPELQRNTPELLYQLARIEFREGRFEQGLSGLDRALRSPAGRAPLFRARLLNARGAMHVRLERSAEAERDFAAAKALVDPTRHHAEMAQSLTGRGVARAMQRDFDGALADLGQARVQALRAGDPLAASRIDANLGQLEMDRDRPAQALQYVAAAARDFEQYGAVNELVSARSTLVVINLRLLRQRAAEAESGRAWALRDRVRDPAQLGTLVLDRAEVLVRSGRLAAARALLAGPESRTVPPGDAQRRAFLLLEADWRAGDVRGALRQAARLLADPAPPVNLRRQAWVRLRQRQAALAADAPMPDWPEGLAGPAWIEALARGLAERQAGRQAGADAAYRDALRIVEAEGVPEDVLEVVADYAPWLIERGRSAEASALVGRVAPWADQDFDAALLQWRLYQALRQDALADRALVQARALAGERPLPAGAIPVPGATAD